MIHIRKAEETDRNSVALCIAEGFEKENGIAKVVIPGKFRYETRRETAL